MSPPEPSTSTDGAPAKTTGLVRYWPELEAEVIAFQRAAYPHRRADWIAPRWRWMFLDSAARLGAAPLVWLFRKPTGVLAHQGVIPVELSVAGRRLHTGWFVETMVLESNRAGTLGPGVIAKTKEDLPLNLSLGQTPAMRAIQFQMGWKQVGPLETLVWPVAPWALLEGKFRWSAARAAACVALAIRQRWRRLRAAAAVGRARDVALEPISDFTAAHDTLWRAIEPDYRCAVVRDASYLRWKYVTQPGQVFHRFNVRRAGQLIGVVVLKFIEPGGAYPYRRAQLVEWVLPANDAAQAQATLAATVRYCQTQRAAALFVFMIHHRLVAQAQALGFLRREPTRVFLVSTPGADAETEAALLEPRNWLLTQGDSDIDRPWADTAGNDDADTP